MIKKGEINIGDVFYSPRTLGIIPLNIREPLIIDKHIVTGIKEYPWGISLESETFSKGPEGKTFHHFGTRGDKAYKSIDELKILLDKTLEAMIKKREAEISRLQKELLEISTYELKINDHTSSTPIYNKEE